MFQRVDNSELNHRQKENYKFQRVAACMVDYDFNCLPLTDGWQVNDCSDDVLHRKALGMEI